MAWAQEMKNLAADIKTGHKDRTAKIGEIKRETKDILGVADNYIKKVAAELKEMARGLKDFLAKSEETRKGDFNVLMKDIRARIKDIEADIKALLTKSEEKRMVDFKATMKDIRGDIDAVKKSVVDILGSTKNLISRYTSERKEAARYWAGLGGREAVEEAVAEEKPKRRGRRKK